MWALSRTQQPGALTARKLWRCAMSGSGTSSSDGSRFGSGSESGAESGAAGGSPRGIGDALGAEDLCRLLVGAARLGFRPPLRQLAKVRPGNLSVCDQAFPILLPWLVSLQLYLLNIMDDLCQMFSTTSAKPSDFWFNSQVMSELSPQVGLLEPIGRARAVRAALTLLLLAVKTRGRALIRPSSAALPQSGDPRRRRHKGRTRATAREKSVLDVALKPRPWRVAQPPGLRVALAGLDGGMEAAMEARHLVVTILKLGTSPLSSSSSSSWRGRGAASVLWAAGIASEVAHAHSQSPAGGSRDRRMSGEEEGISRQGMEGPGKKGRTSSSSGSPSHASFLRDNGVWQPLLRSRWGVRHLERTMQDNAFSASKGGLDAHTETTPHPPLSSFTLDAAGNSLFHAGIVPTSLALNRELPDGDFGPNLLDRTTRLPTTSVNLDVTQSSKLNQRMRLSSLSASRSGPSPEMPCNPRMLQSLLSDLASGSVDLGPRQLAMALWALPKLLGSTQPFGSAGLEHVATEPLLRDVATAMLFRCCV